MKNNQLKGKKTRQIMDKLHHHPKNKFLKLKDIKQNMKNPFFS